MSSNGCLEFRAHPLRPDKCRNCFADLSRHQANLQQVQPAAGALDGRPSGAATSESKAQTSEEKSPKTGSSVQANPSESATSEVRAGGDVARSRASCARCEQLSAELEKMRAKCDELNKQRDESREELRALEKEMEEMHDNFKEDESEQFEQLKQELDLAMKNCKILQIRLGKSERQYGQLEQVKSMLEKQLSEESGGRPIGREESAQQQQQQHQAATFAQLGPETVKLSTGEYDQLLRDLNDTIERERDLQEQIKYSQEEAQLKSDRLQAIETENELLASKVSKLTLANARLRSNRSLGEHPSGDQIVEDSARAGAQPGDPCKLIEQNEQLKLALELAQGEAQRLRNKLQETSGQLESKESSLKECEAKNYKLEEQLLRLSCQLEQSKQAGRLDQESLAQAGSVEQVSKLELECRQLRARLVHSERDCKQLKAQLELSAGGRQSRTGEHSSGSASMAVSAGEQAKIQEINRQLKEQCESLKSQNAELLRRLERLSVEQNVGKTVMESDLLDKLKRQLEISENELAKARSRLVELDLECSRAQRQYKRLVSSLEGSPADSGASSRRAKLPAESMRDAMSRQELRRALKDLEEDLEESLATVRAKDSLIKELTLVGAELRAKLPASDSNGSESVAVETEAATRSNTEEQLKSLRRILDQERLLSNNLKIDVRNLEQSRLELMSNNRMLERERVSMEEELEKLRELNTELNLNLEEAKQTQRGTSNRLIELQVVCENLRNELAESRKRASPPETERASGSSAEQSAGDLLLMARDLSELKVKNGFLMRQLEIAQEDGQRQLDDLRMACEAQQRRAVEMAQLEVKERHLAETQPLRDELNELKQKLAASQRQAARNEEAVSGQQDRLRAAEREWKREKGNWLQRIEQLEAQLILERRSNEFKSKEVEAQVREKERELIGIQDRCVQVERDLKRLQNKYSLLEENSELKRKNLERELEAKKRELSDLVAEKRVREQEYYENCKRFNSEKATLVEALESIRSSFGEKQLELKRARELLVLRQDQAYKERTGAQERLDGLGRELLRLSEHESQAKVLRQQVEANERQFEALRRECCQLKEEKTRLRQRCDELERRCSQYEKQELITKTGNISSSSGSSSFLRTRLSFGNSSASSQSINKQRAQPDRAGQSERPEDKGAASQSEMVERLGSKVNDQRHLINMLKQQYEEAQLELKQLRLVQSCERARWQSQQAQLVGRLNECEERLLFETSLVINQDLFDSSRRNFEAKWAEERRSTLDTLQQVQAQNDLLMRDMKKLGQSHDLLRLQSKQLESHNNKLSKRLIEYQQQPQQLAGANGSSRSALSENDTNRKLEACLSERQAQLGRVTRENEHLTRVLRDQVKPLVETVSKMVAALDGSGAPDSGSSARASQSSLLDGTQSNSTKRPLVAPSPTPSRQLNDSDHISSGQPAHQLAAAGQQQSRLSRLLNVGKTAKPASDRDEPEQARTNATKTTKSVKRVKIKSAALGISATERKELRRRLQELEQELDELERSPTRRPAELELAQRRLGSAMKPSSAASRDRSGELRASSADRDLSSLGSISRGRSQRAGSYAPHSSLASASLGDSSPQSRVHWCDSSTGVPADCSDLDSERSWSTSQLERANLYKRFPQASPASYLAGASLTDCESDCSLASELSSGYSAGGQLLGVAGSSRRLLVSGAESDGCIGSASLGAPKGAVRKRKGLKTRLTSTLRNISRSITGLASDSETEGAAPSSKQPSSSSWLAGRKQQADAPGKQEDEEEARSRSLREIRV